MKPENNDIHDNNLENTSVNHAADVELDDESSEVPYLSRYFRDKHGQIVCDESSEYWVNFGTAIVFYAASLWVISQTSLENTVDDIFIYSLRSVFAIIATYFLFFGLRSYIRHKKFGISVFHIINEYGRIGGSLSGRITISTDIRPTGDYQLKLQCVRKDIRLSRDGKSTTKLVYLWEGKQAVNYKTVSPKAGIQVTFAIPGKLPVSTDLDGDGQIQWTLIVSAPTSGLNYKAAFIISVF